MSAPSHIPPLRFDALTRYYDRVLQATLREGEWRPRLVAQLGLRAGHRVLELGCGTGSLSLRMHAAAPQAEIVALDADPQALGLAEAKAAQAGAALSFQRGLIQELRCEPASFDRIVSSLVFHHLTPEAKRVALASAREWLRPGGELHIADWGRAGSLAMRAAFLGVQLLDGFECTRDHARMGLTPFLERAGFAEVEETHRQRTALGVVSLYRGVRPA